MSLSGWIYFIFTVVLFVVFVVILNHYYNPRRNRSEKEEVEKPKYKMLDDDE